MDAISVIIPAYNAAPTVGRAVASALAASFVGEVIVIDDCSEDETAAVACRSAAGSDRLRLLLCDRNRGPGYARNWAIDQSRFDLVALLDADDMVVPGRFEHLLTQPDWDLVADNVAFIQEDRTDRWDLDLESPPGPARTLETAEFILRNIAIRGKPRSELGFLKPLLRRDFLDRHALRYEENLRLGEDYIFYLRCLAAGARFKVLPRCGYIAMERANSLSGRFRPEMLAALIDAEQAVIEQGKLSALERRLAFRHKASIEKQWSHRAFLEIRRRKGAAAAIRHIIAHPLHAVPIAQRIALDKIAAASAKLKPVHRDASIPSIRLLLDNGK